MSQSAVTSIGSLALALLALSSVAAGRPYEMDWAGRTNDAHAATCPLTGPEGWTVVARDAVGALSVSPDHRLFGEGAMRLTYRATGKRPELRLRPPAPIAVGPSVDAMTLWVYGNTSPAFHPDPTTPVTFVHADFIDSDGRRFTVMLSKNNFLEWFMGSHRFTAAEKKRMAKGGRFVELIVNGCTNAEDRSLDFNSLCLFKEDLKPLAFKERPKRGVRIFPDQPQGINTGAGTLPFPTVATTVVPRPEAVDPTLEFRFPKDPSKWDELAFRRGKGPWIPVAVGGGVFPPQDGVQADFKRIGNSIVCDLAAKGGTVEEVRFGRIVGFPEARHVPVPYYTFKKWKGLAGRPGVVAGRLDGKPFFVAQTFDWTQSNASDVFGPDPAATNAIASNGGVIYRPKTDGRRNDVYERFVWSFADAFADVLPEIPNPVSPWKAATANRTWIPHGASRDRTADVKLWRERHRNGLRHMIVTDHESQWRDGYESFTYRTRTAPAKGGDRGQYDYTRVMIDELGYLYGPYNCFCELAPVNAWWTEDRTARTADDQLMTSWERCFVPKPAWQPTACEEISAELQRKFRFNTAYCDVHTCVSPWSETDYDARSPGAGTFAQTFYSYGEVMLIQRQTWQGPVYSEGVMHWPYCGLTDGNYAHDPEYGIATNPWLVDFDLLRLHPKCVNFGMGTESMFGAKGDRFLCAEIAFGHSAFLIWADGLWRSVYMVQGVASRSCLAEAESIRYGTADGRLEPTSEAVLSGSYRRNQVAVRYSDGMRVFANGNTNEAFAVTVGKKTVALPPNGWFAVGSDVLSFSGDVAGHRVDCAVAPDYVYFDGRGKMTEFPVGRSDGAVLRLLGEDGTEEVFLGRKATRVELPYVAVIMVALDEKYREVSVPVPVRVGGRTVLVPQKGVCSWRVTRPAGVCAPAVSECVEKLIGN